MVLKLGNKEVVCEDVLESMIVFSEYWWIGNKEENPNEDQLPMPSSLAAPRHSKFDFGGRPGGKPGAASQPDELVPDDDDEEEAEEDPVVASQVIWPPITSFIR